jgi:FMN phosphatase YigB (HAD superfamily)
VTSVTSFDVFETVLVRAVGEPSAVFLLLGRQLRAQGLSTLEPAMFASARLQAEQRARRRRPGVDTTLQAIYAELGHVLRLDGDSAHRLAAAEMALEERLLHAPDWAVSFVERTRRRGDRVIFVSDSYLPRDFLQHILASHGLWRSGDGLYVSSDHDGANKRSGALFEVVLSAEGVPAHAITHVGNHAIADIERARALGWNTRHHPAGNLRADEKLLERHDIATGGLTSAMAGASRLARLSALDVSAREAVIRDVSAAVAGPTLIAYVLWVLLESSRRGLARLYFLAREGQVLLEIARRLLPKLGLDVELRYLYVSRQSLNLAAVRDITSAELDWALTNVETNSVRTLLQRLGIEPEEVGQQLEVLGFPRTRWDEVPSTASRRQLVGHLSDGTLRPALERGLGRGREVVLRYLQQEGVLDPVEIGMVDTTGAGSQLRALARLRREHRLSSPICMLFYRKLASAPVPDDDEPWLLAWYEDQVKDLGCGLPPGRAALLEVFAAADHGTVLGYETAGDGVRPRLAPWASEIGGWGLDRMRRTILDTAQHLVLDPELVDLEADLRAAVREVMARLWSTPTPDEAAVWGRFPFEGTSGQDAAEPLARPYKMREVLVGARAGGLPFDSWYFWSEASEAVSPPSVRTAIQAARAVKHRLGLLQRGRAVYRLQFRRSSKA